MCVCGMQNDEEGGCCLRLRDKVRWTFVKWEMDLRKKLNKKNGKSWLQI